MNSINKLAQMGCGTEMINSQIDRSNIHAATWNARRDLKYALGYFKSIRANEFSTKEQKQWEYDYLLNHLNKSLAKLKSVEWLVQIYKELYLELFSEVKLKTEKLISEITKQ